MLLVTSYSAMLVFQPYVVTHKDGEQKFFWISEQMQLIIQCDQILMAENNVFVHDFCSMFVHMSHTNFIVS